MPAWRARFLVQRKLKRLHPAYNQIGRVETSFFRQWREYNRLLSRHMFPLVGYDEWIERVETKLLAKEHDASLAQASPPTTTDHPITRQVPKITIWLWGDRSHDELVTRSVQSVEAQFAGGFQVLPQDTSLAEAHEGCWLMLLCAGDVISPHALRRFSNSLSLFPEAKIIYADEDLFDEHSHRHTPHFKSAWNLDLFYANPKYSHSWWVRSDLVIQACRQLEVAGVTLTPYELLLEVAMVCESRDVVHIPEILYHRFQRSTSLHSDAATAAALQQCLTRHGQQAQVSLDQPGRHRVDWYSTEPEPLVSLIIPTRDHGDLLKQCLNSLAIANFSNTAVEVIIIDNGSTEASTLEYLQQLDQQSGYRVLRMPGPFNYSKLNNQAAQVAQGDILIFMNNDVQVVSKDWLSVLLAQVRRPGVGAVGAKLLFEGAKLPFEVDTVQHAGVVLGIGGIAGHAHKYFPHDSPGYHNRLQLVQQMSAVTAAVLAIRKSVFLESGGFDEEAFAINYNDVDLCLRLQKAGYKNIYTPYAVFYHHESRSRGEPTDPLAHQLWQRERAAMQARWSALLKADPFYNPHLSLNEEDFSLWLSGASSLAPRQGL